MAKQYKDTVEYFLIYAELITAAQRRGLVTYGELASLVGLPPSGNYMGSAIGNYLGVISENEVAQGRPMLSALTVDSTGAVGKGFFDIARSVGLFTTEDVEARTQFWEAQKKAVYETWRRGVKRTG
ncbi:MAG: hypothetical protein SF123_12225 [Chloroflexota bacterium]|nr:hypothetical protein [Chloroflexota bacterium]